MADPRWKLRYRGQNVTDAIERFVLRVRVEDKLEFAASKVEIELEDSEGLWRGPWAPARGDRVELQIGYQGLFGSERLGLPVEYEVDEIELNGPPDKVIVRGISAAITRQLRTRRTQLYSGLSLLEVVAAVAQRNHLTLNVGTGGTARFRASQTPGQPPVWQTGGSKDIQLSKIVQKHETDVGFLQRLANLYGYNFSVRGGQLIFIERQLLERQDGAFTLARSGDRGFAGLLPASEQIHVKTFSFLIRTERVYKRAIVSYHHPIQKRLITYTVEADPADLDPSNAGAADPAERLPPDATAFLTFSGNAATGDTLKIQERCEGEADARAKAEAALHANNMRKQTCKMTIVGEPIVASGLVGTVRGFDRYDGNYLLESSTHTLDRAGGYDTELAARFIS